MTSRFFIKEEEKFCNSIYQKRFFHRTIFRKLTPNNKRNFNFFWGQSTKLLLFILLFNWYVPSVRKSLTLCSILLNKHHAFIVQLKWFEFWFKKYWIFIFWHVFVTKHWPRLSMKGYCTLSVFISWPWHCVTVVISSTWLTVSK